MKTQPATGETYPKSDLFNKASEALKLAERIGVTAAARELSLYESQLYNWRSKQQNQQTSSERELEMSTEIARLKRQLAERDEELAILQKAATYFAKRLK
ncbi:TPA: transposase [Escherichia coli]|uniref:Transposase n=1 Tax=Escherichia coli TaxID=562 RepID=A0A8E2KTD9_ECOLX|nr:transposase [Escherichia coli]ESA69375.1 transposase [Escherichia coli 113290]API46664.1 transposase [Escherichia coli]EFC4808269.1 transposase [Escherichia coli]EGZ8341386.1 transposase [Escherichia coli]